MANLTKRTDVTSADTKQIGFEYQYLYFILRLLQLSYGEEVGYEALDDVHIVNANSSVKSIEDLIIKESIIFSNFSSRYQEKLILSTKHFSCRDSTRWSRLYYFQNRKEDDSL
jgi:hypothetical protein